MQGLVSVFPALESRRRREETVTNGLIRDTWRVTRLLTVAHISAQSYKNATASSPPRSPHHSQP